MGDSSELAGRVLAGRYRLEEQLGRGGMGSVWRADDKTLGSPVAIKLLDPSLAENESARARFYQEAKAAAALRSPHVVQTLDYGVDGGLPFIAMELLEGETLADRLQRTRVLPLAHTARIFTDVARALHKAHAAGIVHRDLKPENVFLVQNDDQEVAKILDFGVAKVGGDPENGVRNTRAGTLLGTVPYMSPEQARGQSIDFRADLWSLAVMAFECVCGRLPFPAEHPTELVIQICADDIPVPSRVARVPLGFDAWFAKAAARDPADRFGSAKEMVDALNRVLVALRGASGQPSLRAAGLSIGTLSDPTPTPMSIRATADAPLSLRARTLESPSSPPHLDDVPAHTQRVPVLGEVLLPPSSSPISGAPPSAPLSAPPSATPPAITSPISAAPPSDPAASRPGLGTIEGGAALVRGPEGAGRSSRGMPVAVAIGVAALLLVGGASFWLGGRKSDAPTAAPKPAAPPATAVAAAPATTEAPAAVPPTPPTTPPPAATEAPAANLPAIVKVTPTTTAQTQPALKPLKPAAPKAPADNSKKPKDRIGF